MRSIRKKIRAVRRAARTVRSVMRTWEPRRFQRFGLRVELSRTCFATAQRLRARSLPFFARQYDRAVTAWFAKEYADAFEKWRDPSAIAPPAPKMKLEPGPRIWTMWYQGLESAPEIVKQCIASMERNRGDAELIVLDADNLKQYLDIDAEMEDKVKRGIFSLTEFSNFVRTSLMYLYGGLWLDSTVWLNHALTPAQRRRIFDAPFYSLHSADWPDFFIMTAFTLAFRAGSPAAGFIRDIYLAYFRAENMAVEYYLFDLLFSVGYHSFPWFREIVDGRLDNTTQAHIQTLLVHLKSGDLEAAVCDMRDEATWFYKCSQKWELKIYPDDVLRHMQIDVPPRGDA